MSAHVSPPKRPRLSLQIKPVVGINSRSSRAFGSLDPKDPTTFNTLSNAYSGAIDRSTPTIAEPITAINVSDTWRNQRVKAQTPCQPYAKLPETPFTAHPASPSAPSPVEMSLPSATMTATPPVSAGLIDSNDQKGFTLAPSDATPRQVTLPFSPTELRTPHRRSAANSATPKAPYSHPRTLHSILRNSPLPNGSARSPASPRRQSLRLKEKAAKRVGYNDPLTQTITTNKYTKSHIDLLVEEASPYSPVPAEDDPEVVLDLALAYTSNETRDGGMTPGPFEEMRRRMAGLGTESPISPVGIRKRKKKEKKRHWVWTIGQDEDDEEEVGGAMAAIRAAEKAGTITISTPRPPVRKVKLAPEQAPGQTPEPVRDTSSEPESVDTIMSDTSSTVSEDNMEHYRYDMPGGDWMDLDTKTPTVENPDGRPKIQTVIGPLGLVNETREGRTLIPACLIPSRRW